MSAHEMPGLLLDGQLAVDADMSGMDATMGLDEVDLFGDPVITRPPPSKHLQQRLDELRSRGCCQAIAWSRQGTIASVTKDGSAIDLRFLSCHPDNGSWDLSAPTTYSIPSPGGIPISHLAWGPTGSPELAVIDAVGRISILSFSITLNRPYTSRRWDSDPSDDLHAVVGCYWLPLLVPPNRQYHVMHGPAVWNQSEYKFENSVTHASGPWHPNGGKSALVCVTTNGFVKLIYSQHNNRIEETSLELESVISSDDSITHASISSDKNTLLIALATASRQLKVVRVAINWGIPAQADKQVPPTMVQLSPSLRDKSIAATSWLQHGPSESALDACMAQLSHVEVLPSFLENTSPEAPSESPSVVLTVRSHVPQDGSYSHEYQSIIDRWEVSNDQSQSLHTAFEQLGSKNGHATQLPAMTRLNKLDSIVIPKIVISIHTIHLGKVVCFAFSDGTVQYRDRTTMNEVYNELNLTSIMSPHQVGFQYTNETPCLQVAFSPTNCSFAQICEDGSVKWIRLHHPMEDAATSLQGTQYSAILASLSIAISPAVYHSMNCDDILAIARPFTKKPDFTYTWVRTLINMVKVPVDYSEEAHHDQLVRNSNLLFCMSILNHLGFHGEFQPRTFGGKFAMLALNIRNIVILITIASNTPVNLKEKLSPLDEPDVVASLAGCAKWAADLLSWLADSIFNLWDDKEFRDILEDQKRFPELSNYMHRRGDVSLHLLLCSSTRGFLTAACRRLGILESLGTRAMMYYDRQAATEPHTAITPLHAAYLKLQRATGSSLIKVQDFEQLVTALSQDIRANYQKTLAGLKGVQHQHQQQQQHHPNNKNAQQQQQGTNDQVVKKAQTHAELDMLLAGNPPPSFRDMLLKFFQGRVSAFRAQTDPPKLFFGNYDILEVEDDARSLAMRRQKGEYVDVFTRATLRSGVVNGAKGGKGGGSGSGSGRGGSGSGSGMGVGTGGEAEGPQWRRCVRCASVMLDVYGSRPGFTFVLAQQRKCSCGGSWGLLPRGSLVN